MKLKIINKKVTFRFKMSETNEYTFSKNFCFSENIIDELYYTIEIASNGKIIFYINKYTRNRFEIGYIKRFSGDIGESFVLSAGVLRKMLETGVIEVDMVSRMSEYPLLKSLQSYKELLPIQDSFSYTESLNCFIADANLINAIIEEEGLNKFAITACPHTMNMFTITNMATGYTRSFILSNYTYAFYSFALYNDYVFEYTLDEGFCNTNIFKSFYNDLRIKTIEWLKILIKNKLSLDIFPPITFKKMDKKFNIRLKLLNMVLFNFSNINLDSPLLANLEYDEEEQVMFLVFSSVNMLVCIPIHEYKSTKKLFLPSESSKVSEFTHPLFFRDSDEPNCTSMDLKEIILNLSHFLRAYNEKFSSEITNKLLINNFPSLVLAE